MKQAGADTFTFHIEAMTERQKDVNKIIDLIKSNGMKPGIAIKPNTPVASVEPYLDELFLVRLWVRLQ